MLVGRGALQLESSQHDQIVAHDGKMHVALKVGPTFPETATQTKDAFGRGDGRCCMIQLRREWGRFSNFSFRTPQRRISAYPARPSG